MQTRDVKNNKEAFNDSIVFLWHIKGKMEGRRQFVNKGGCAPPKCTDNSRKTAKTTGLRAKAPTTQSEARPSPAVAVTTTETAQLDAEGASVPRGFNMGGQTPPCMQVVSPQGATTNHNSIGLKEAGLSKQGRKHQIKKFVKETLFPHMKFFVNEDELIWNPSMNSPCQFVVQGLKVSNDSEECRHWWHKHHSLVVKELNRKRSDVVAGMKKVFFGTKIVCVQRCKKLIISQQCCLLRS
jgi:hypothetical protein